MSGITTVSVQTGQYKCLECLDKTLIDLGQSSSINIIHQQESYQISINKETRGYLARQVSEQLENQIQKFHESILPKYTENHAIHSLENQGFKIKKIYTMQDGYKIIMEKVSGSGPSERIDRYEISVLPKENRILIDGGNMPGMHCRKNAKKFQTTMGEFVNFAPHEQLDTLKIKEKTSTKTYQQIKGGSNR